MSVYALRGYLSEHISICIPPSDKEKTPINIFIASHC